MNNITGQEIVYAPIYGSNNHQVDECSLDELRDEPYNSNRFIPGCDYIDFSWTRGSNTDKIFRRIMYSPGEYINLIPCRESVRGNKRWTWFNLNSLLYTYDSGEPLYPKYYHIPNIQERVELLLEDEQFVPIRINTNIEDDYREEIQIKAIELKDSIDNLVFLPFSISRSLSGLNTLGTRVILPDEGRLLSIKIGISFLRLLLASEQNPVEFNKLFNIRFKMPIAEFLRGLVLGKSTIGIYYNREEYTFIVETNMGNNVKSVIEWLRRDLFTEMRTLKQRLPSERFATSFESIVYETYFRDYK